ncbi:MAG: toxin-antitoxin system HicB family antitoxin [Candidatus Latescibacteria bacterium]|nr:toxin-antitoxin system HicB family antitoxin [Candidatus Latescibacterota bacterium]
MSALSVRLPDSLHQRVRELAVREGVSINQLIATALAEKMSALMTADYLEERARRGSRAKFLAALAQVPDVEPEPYDRLPSMASGKRRKSGAGAKGITKERHQTRTRRG